jgi:uncharacterized membrane protein YtjA (UPF0391 family)
MHLLRNAADRGAAPGTGLPGGGSLGIGNGWRTAMLAWIITLMVLALASGVLGFGGVLQDAATLAQILFAVFLILLLISLVYRAIQNRP